MMPRNRFLVPSQRSALCSSLNVFRQPEIDTIIVHRPALTHEFAIARNLRKTGASPAGGEFTVAIADMVVGARV
mgnify:CR=1 FL=1